MAGGSFISSQLEQFIIHQVACCAFNLEENQIRSLQRQNSLKPEEGLRQLESVVRITNIPIVESGWKYAGNVYSRIKNSSSLAQWTLGTAESSLNMAVDITLPSAVSLLNAPIQIIDKIVCKSLDVVEQRVPSMYLPPQVMVWQTKEYVNDKLVKPVLKRADSMREVGNAVLASKYTAYAADTLEGALTVADKYVDKYLPDAADQAIDGNKYLQMNAEVSNNRKPLDIKIYPSTSVDIQDEEADSAKSPPAEGPTGKAVNTIHHVDRLSRKLQRRLTKRTIAEAKALRERSAESMHVLLYVAELVATDPKLAMRKAIDLWQSLSEDEPENQARPATLEQLIVMLTRESARRVVHLINYTRSAVYKLPGTISHGVNLTTNQMLRIVDRLAKRIRLEGEATMSGTKQQTQTIIQQLNTFSGILLERLALAVAGQPETRKQMRSSTKHRNHHHHSVQHSQSIHAQSVLRTQYRPGGQHRHSSSVLNNGAQS